MTTFSCDLMHHVYPTSQKKKKKCERKIGSVTRQRPSPWISATENIKWMKIKFVGIDLNAVYAMLNE